MYIKVTLCAVLNLKAHPWIWMDIWVNTYMWVIYDYDKLGRLVALWEQ